MTTHFVGMGNLGIGLGKVKLRGDCRSKPPPIKKETCEAKLSILGQLH